MNHSIRFRSLQLLYNITTILCFCLVAAIVVSWPFAAAAAGDGHHLLGFDHLHTIQMAVRQHVQQQQQEGESTEFDYTGENIDILHRRRRSLQQQDETSAQESSFDLQSMCVVIEQSFVSEYNVTCICAGNVIDNFSISCDYNAPVCTSSNNSTIKTCGTPQIAISMVQQQVFSSTTCIRGYTRNNVPLNDTCVFVDTCANTLYSPNTEKVDASVLSGSTTSSNRELHRPTFCDCTASYGNTICDTCQICPGSNGDAITVDCRNVNAQAISNQCTEIDLDLHLSANASTSSSSSSTMAGFAPEFTGFCTQLEDSINNTISCDCTNAIGGSYNISCRTNDRVCVRDDDVHCGTVDSTVAVVEGTIDTVTACATYDTPPFATTSSGGSSDVTCTTMHLCSSSPSLNDTSSTAPHDDDDVCRCSATYENQPCNSCTVRTTNEDGTTSTPVVDDSSATTLSFLSDTTYITLDCSNVHPNAITDTPQPIYAKNSYEFLPYYNRMISAANATAINNDGAALSFDTDKRTNSGSRGSYQSVSSYFVAVLSVTFLLALLR